MLSTNQWTEHQRVKLSKHAKHGTGRQDSLTTAGSGQQLFGHVCHLRFRRRDVRVAQLELPRIELLYLNNLCLIEQTPAVCTTNTP